MYRIDSGHYIVGQHNLFGDLINENVNELFILQMLEYIREKVDNQVSDVIIDIIEGKLESR